MIIDRTKSLMLPLAALVLVPACGIFGGGSQLPPPEEPLLLVLEGAPDLNTCGRDTPNALAIRIYQLSAAISATAIPQPRLWEADEQELAKDLVYRRELFLDPGGEEVCELPGKAEARHLMVAGNFCLTEGDCWRWIGPMPEKGGTMRLRFGPTCILEVAGAKTGK